MYEKEKNKTKISSQNTNEQNTWKETKNACETGHFIAYDNHILWLNSESSSKQRKLQIMMEKKIQNDIIHCVVHRILWLNVYDTLQL